MVVMVKSFPVLIGFLFLSSSAFAQSYSNFDICKAAISTEMSRKVKTMKILKSDSEMPQIEYKRNDGDKFKYQCMFEGNKVIWRGYFSYGWGRWRNTDSNDSEIIFAVKNGTLEIYNSSTGNTYKFNRKDF